MAPGTVDRVRRARQTSRTEGLHLAQLSASAGAEPAQRCGALQTIARGLRGEPAPGGVRDC